MKPLGVMLQEGSQIIFRLYRVSWMTTDNTLPPPMNHVFVDYENVHAIDLAVIGNKGVTFYLNAVQFARHGEKMATFDVGAQAQSMFAKAGALPAATGTAPAGVGFGPNTATPGSTPPGVPFGFAAPPAAAAAPAQQAAAPAAAPAFAGARPFRNLVEQVEVEKFRRAGQVGSLRHHFSIFAAAGPATPTSPTAPTRLRCPSAGPGR